jgi:hypothetical protein
VNLCERTLTDETFHERLRLGSNLESQLRGETGSPQDAYCILREGFTDMAQQASLQIVHPTEGVMEEPSFINRHRIDREISSPEITLKRAITVPRQRILVVGLGV